MITNPKKKAMKVRIVHLFPKFVPPRADLWCCEN